MIELWRSRRGRLSTRLTEFWSTTQKLKPADRDGAWTCAIGWQPLNLDDAVLDRHGILDRYSSVWDDDCWSSHVGGCLYLLTGISRTDRTSPGVVNPFLFLPSAIVEPVTQFVLRLCG
jgi:hypothetical protein